MASRLLDHERSNIFTYPSDLLSILVGTSAARSLQYYPIPTTSPIKGSGSGLEGEEPNILVHASVVRPKPVFSSWPIHRVGPSFHRASKKAFTSLTSTIWVRSAFPCTSTLGSSRLRDHVLTYGSLSPPALLHYRSSLVRFEFWFRMLLAAVGEKINSKTYGNNPVGELTRVYLLVCLVCGTWATTKVASISNLRGEQRTQSEIIILYTVILSSQSSFDLELLYIFWWRPLKTMSILQENAGPKYLPAAPNDANHVFRDLKVHFLVFDLCYSRTLHSKVLLSLNCHSTYQDNIFDN